MINLFPLVLVLAIAVENEAWAYRTNDKEDTVILLKERRNRDELTKIVQILNGGNEFEDLSERRDDEDASNHIYKHEKMKELENKYPKEYDKNSEPAPRIHYIKNAEVLDKYVKYLRKESSSSSETSSGEAGSSDSNSAGERTARPEVRRNAMFRVSQDASNEEIKGGEQDHKDGANKDNKDLNTRAFLASIEDQVTPFKTHLVSEEYKKDFENIKYPNLDDENRGLVTKRFKVKSKSSSKLNKSKDKANIWEAEDKFYDWKKTDDGKSGEMSKFNKKKSTSDWNEKDALMLDDKTKIRERSNENDSAKRKVEKAKKKKKNIKESRKQKDSLDQENEWTTKRQLDFDDNQTKKTTKEWDEPKPRKKKVDWFSPHEKVVDNDWDKVGRNWEKGQKERDVRKPSKSSWKKKMVNHHYERPSYIGRIPEHQKYRGREGNGSFQGRTPIPFIGKRGIYDDK